VRECRRGSYFASRHWYDTFPGFGMQWLPPLGPYNEHFVKDGAALYAGLLLLTAAAVYFAADDLLVVLTATAWTTFNVLHLAYHVTMLHMVPTLTDTFLGVGTLMLLALVSAVLLVPLRAADHQRMPRSDK
jgi:hypothetical protein